MGPKSDWGASRRDFIRLGGRVALAASLLAARPAGLLAQAPAKPQEDKAEAQGETEVTPTEDLMREHGVLRRILLIYDDARTRVGEGSDYPADVLASAAGIVRRFIEDYHEKLEENYLFPKFMQAGKLTDLVPVLLAQHQAGRRLTDALLAQATPNRLKDAAVRRSVADNLRQFIRMYQPHAAREDTVLFPALHDIMKPSEYKDMGDAFEQRERDLFGEGGFEKMVGNVADLERRVGLYDLAQFTPRV